MTNRVKCTAVKVLSRYSEVLYKEGPRCRVVQLRICSAEPPAEPSYENRKEKNIQTVT